MAKHYETWTDVFSAAAHHRPDGTAFSLQRKGAAPEEVTRASLLDSALRVAGGLQSLGIQKGSVVVLMGEPSVAWVVTLSAVLLCGAMPLPIDPRSTNAEFQRIMALSGAGHAVVSGQSPPAHSASEFPTRRIVTWKRGLDNSSPSIEEMTQLAPVDPVRVSPGDPGIVLQTSGTTGRPKCVVHTHESHMRFLSTWTDMTMRGDDRVLNFLPLNHQGGLLLSWLAAFSVGASTYQLDRYSLEAFWAAVEAYDITWTILMQPVPQYLLEGEPRSDDRNHRLRYVNGGGGPAVVAGLKTRFGIRLVHPYGSTETTVVTMSLDHDRHAAQNLTPEQAVACAGPTVAGWSIRIVDSDRRRAPANAVGALEVKGPSLFTEYLNDVEATRRAFTEDGWFRTGDRAYVNEHGELFFVERAGTTIRRSGENISAVEVEATLLEHPGIIEACVVPVPDDLRGQEVRACVVRAPGSSITADEIFEHCLAYLTKFKVPRYIDFWERLPRTGTFKVSRTALESDRSRWIDRYAPAGPAPQ